MGFIRTVVAGLACVLATGASAAIVSVDGDNVRFTYDDSTLYGTGTVVGDSILFIPDSFVAESLNGEGAVMTSEMLSIQVEVISDGYFMDTFRLVEQGDYFLNGAGASASVSGSFSVDSNTSSNSTSLNFNGGPLTVQNSLTEWSTGAFVNLADDPSWVSDTDVTLDITNDLMAATEAEGEQALVQKKLGAVGLTITAVPVPAAVWLFGSGLLGLLGWARRRVSGQA